MRTSDDHVLFLLRLVLGCVMFTHGAQKALGWFGGPGFSGTLSMFGQGMGIPAPLAVLAIAAEFLGGLGLIFGFLGRIGAAGIAVNMVVAAVMVHATNGFFMNWAGNQKGEGFEYHLLALAMAISIVVRGSGAWSIDHALERGAMTGHQIPHRVHG